MSKAPKKWTPLKDACSGCAAPGSYSKFTWVRYAGKSVGFCYGQGDQPKAECVRRFAARARVCVGCGKGELAEADQAHRWRLDYRSKSSVQPGTLCSSCSDALDRGWEARRSDEQAAISREERNARVWILRAIHFKGYTHALAAALTGGQTWEASAPSAPPGEEVREVPCSYRFEPGDMKLESPQLDPKAVWTLKLEIDRLLVLAELKGYRKGNDLLRHVAEGRYTAPGYDDAQDRVATDYHRRLAELEKELAE